MKKLKLFFVLMALTLVMSACADKEESVNPEDETEDIEDEVIDENAVDKSDTISKDEDAEKEIADEEGVTNATLTITEDAGGFIIVDFDVESDMKEERAEEIAEKYAKKLQEKYEDVSVDVQARKDGETFAQVTLEKE